MNEWQIETKARNDVYLAIQMAKNEDLRRTLARIREHDRTLIGSEIWGIRLYRLPRAWEKRACKDANAGIADGYFYGYEIRSTFGAKLAVDFLYRWEICFSRIAPGCISGFEARQGRKVIASA